MPCPKCHLYHENVLRGHFHLSSQVLIFLDHFTSEFVQISEQGSKVVSEIWVCLFTYLAIRAIHLELVEDMTAEELILDLWHGEEYHIRLYLIILNSLSIVWSSMVIFW